MKDKHITEILDNTSVANLSEAELNEIQTHLQDCVSCSNAYEAARVSAVILRKRALQTIKPSPFFETRVMAALREQQGVESAMWRLWKSARAVVASMAVTTAALAVLSFVLPAPVPAPVTSGIDQTASVYSAESVIMGQGSDDQMSYEQVLSTIYADDDEAK